MADMTDGEAVEFVAEETKKFFVNLIQQLTDREQVIAALQFIEERARDYLYVYKLLDHAKKDEPS